MPLTDEQIRQWRGKKRCPRCSKLLDLALFNKSRHRPDGLQFYCRPCKNEYRRASRSRNLEKSRAECRAWREKNLPYFREKSKRWYAANRDTIKEANKQWRRENKDRVRKFNKEYHAKNKDRFLVSKYGMAPGDYDRMYAEQEGKCAICRRDSADFKKGLSVDHDHVSGNIRSLLCFSCNAAIGLAQEDPDILMAMIEYVSFWNKARDFA